MLGWLRCQENRVPVDGGLAFLTPETSHLTPAHLEGQGPMSVNTYVPITSGLT